MPLAALANATQGEARQALLDALYIGGADAQDVNEGASRMLYDLTQKRADSLASVMSAPGAPSAIPGEGVTTPLVITNTIITQDNAKLSNDFQKTFMDYYRGNCISVDFSDPKQVSAAIEKISSYAGGLMPDMGAVFGGDPEVIVINAVDFFDKWTVPFDRAETQAGVFHSPTGDVTAKFMYKEGDDQFYYEDSRVRAVRLDFMCDGGMYLILPQTGSANDLLSSMTPDYLLEIQHDSVLATVRLRLPRFSMDTGDMELKEVLKEMGVPLFDPTHAQLSGLTEGKLQWLTSVVQKADVEVDELGTTARAITIIPAASEGMETPTEPVEITFDRPFVFILYADTSGGYRQLLFTGIVNTP